MKQFAFAAIAAAMVCIPVAHAQDEEEPGLPVVPVEIFTCSYLEGKGSGDLDAVIAEWNDWMDDRGVDDYFAMTLTPFYFGASGYSFDVGWLGSWPDGASMGRGTDRWITEGGEMAATFGDVVDCDTHSNFATIELKSPGEGPAPDTIVAAFSDCEVTEGVPFDELMAALESWSAYQEESGYSNGAWMMFPVYGGGGVEFDFKLVDGYDNHTALGADYDRYGRGGDYVKYGELLGDKLECDDARVYNARIRRRPATE